MSFPSVSSERSLAWFDSFSPSKTGFAGKRDEWTGRSKKEASLGSTTDAMSRLRAARF
jgi:hypothetical protein